MDIHLKPMQQAATFQYDDLESQNTFRLLRLHAGKGAEIRCSLHHHTLGSDTCPPYRAISYTWGQDTAQFKIYMPGDTMIMVRRNLKNALHSIRDMGSDHLLWIDAICINQDSDLEHNHQVRLMADIYGNANVVLVWLQSSRESAKVARAFKFLHAAVTHDTSGHSVRNYSRAHNLRSKRAWAAVRALCRLRYWTRKWIIQELVNARTVVLQIGSQKCAMVDLENFCRQLHQNRNRAAYRTLGLAKSVIASPAALLALQRLETRDEQQPRLLHQLVERYAGNQCQDPCDHIYALYSLVGEHRTHLPIDYKASSVQRLVAVLRFVHTYEPIQPVKVLNFANLLIALLGVKENDLQKEHGLVRSLNLVVPATLLGIVEQEDESEDSFELRKMTPPLQPAPIYTLDTTHDVWVSTTRQSRNGGPVSPDDMTFFGLAGSESHGLAASRVEAGDAIWHFPGTQLVFAIRELPDHTALIVSQAYLFSDALEPWLSRDVDYDEARQGERLVSMSLSIMLELCSIGIPVKEGRAGLKLNAKTSPSANKKHASLVARAIWKHRHRLLVIGGLLVTFAFVLAVIMTQVVKA